MISKIISTYRLLSTLYIGNCGLGSSVVKEIANAIDVHGCMRVLNIQNNGLADENASYLISKLLNLKDLKTIDLTQKKISKGKEEELMNLLKLKFPKCDVKLNTEVKPASNST